MIKYFILIIATIAITQCVSIRNQATLEGLEQIGKWECHPHFLKLVTIEKRLFWEDYHSVVFQCSDNSTIQKYYRISTDRISNKVEK